MSVIRSVLGCRISCGVSGKTEEKVIWFLRFSWEEDQAVVRLAALYNNGPLLILVTKFHIKILYGFRLIRLWGRTLLKAEGGRARFCSVWVWLEKFTGVWKSTCPLFDSLCLFFVFFFFIFVKLQCLRSSNIFKDYSKTMQVIGKCDIYMKFVN